MNLKELRNSLAKFGGDFNDAHVMFVTKGKDGKKEYHLLAGVGQILVKQECVALISHDICQDMIADGSMKMKKDLE